MPEVIIVASWRVMIVRSSALTRLQEVELDLLGARACRRCRGRSGRAPSAGRRRPAWTRPRPRPWPWHAGEVDRLEDVGGHGHQAATPSAVRRPMQAAQLLGRRGARLGEALGDLAGADERRPARRPSSACRRCAPVCIARVDLVRLALADEVAHGRRRARAPRQATTRPEPSAVGQQLLGHDALQRDRELHADLVLLVRPGRRR